MNYRGFRIENEPAYIWRLYCWAQFANHSHVPCWYVYDATGKRVAGGYDAGNNTRSGSANLARRKDAKAWVDGWHAFRDEPDNRVRLPNGFVVHGPTYGSHRDSRSESDAWFEHGYIAAQSTEGQTNE